MRKQIDGQINLFDYIAWEEQEVAEKQKQPAQGKGPKKRNKSTLISYFEQCKDCWCSDCRHNEKLEATPRDFAGVKKACPSCQFCLQNKKAEICEIGSYDNGCKLRATEEGVTAELEN